MSFLYPVRPSSSPEGGHILLQPCPLPWLLPPPLHCLLSLESESEVREPFQGRIMSQQQQQHTRTSKASFFPRALDDRALMTLGNVVSTDIISGACAHRRANSIKHHLKKNGLSKPCGQGTASVLITRDLYVLAVGETARSLMTELSL